MSICKKQMKIKYPKIVQNGQIKKFLSWLLPMHIECNKARNDFKSYYIDILFYKKNV